MKIILNQRILRAFMLMILLNVLCLPIANADFGWEQVVGDEVGGGNGFGDSKNDYAYSMTVFGNHLYVGTGTDGESPHGCEVWRSSEGTTWNQVNTDGFGDSNGYGAKSMAVFNGYLYVGTRNPTGGCKVWRSSDGTSWGQVNTDGFGDPGNNSAGSMAVFGEYLYVGTDTFNGCEVWRSSNGDTWDQVNTDGFGDAVNRGAYSMSVFGSYLYVGTFNNPNGCEVWRYFDDSDDDGIKDDEDKCPCHPNGINKGTCVKDVGSVIMSYEEGDELITCDDDVDCTLTGGYCQKVQGDCNWNGIGDVCEGYADFDDSGSVNLVDLMDLILCYGKTNFDTYPDCEKYDTNDDNRVSAWDFLILTLQYGMDGFDTCGVGIAPAQIAKTGQNTCYDSGGTEINCLDTGQDGEYQKGVIGSSPRFTDHGNGTITDNLTGLMWTQDAQQISGMMTWSDALTECNDLIHATYTDWRLPNARELQSLIDSGEYDPAMLLGHPFLNVLSSEYWTSTTFASNSDWACVTEMFSGVLALGVKTTNSSSTW